MCTIHLLLFWYKIARHHFDVYANHPIKHMIQIYISICHRVLIVPYLIHNPSNVVSNWPYLKQKQKMGIRHYNIINRENYFVEINARCKESKSDISFEIVKCLIRTYIFMILWLWQLDISLPNSLRDACICNKQVKLFPVILQNKNYPLPGTHFPNMDKSKFQHGWIITSLVKCVMELLSPSKLQWLHSWSLDVISSHSIYKMWSLIYAGTKLIHDNRRGGHYAPFLLLPLEYLRTSSLYRQMGSTYHRI